MNVRVDTSAFNSMCKNLGRMTGASFENAVEFETAKILEKTASSTIAANVAKIQRTVSRTKISAADRVRVLAAKRGARGLAKQSWFQIGQLIGKVVRVPAFVPAAKPSDGKIRPDAVSVAVVRNLGRFGIRIANFLPTVTNSYVGGARALNRAITGRVRYFTMSLKKGVFTSAAQIARRYPGVRTT